MMPAKKSSEKSRSRSRSRSRGRSERSSSRSRRSGSRSSEASSTKKSKAETKSPKPTAVKKPTRPRKKSTTSTESQDGEVREAKVVNAVSTRLNSDKTIENDETKPVESLTEIITSHKATTVTSHKATTAISESNEAIPSRVSMRLREKRGEVEHCDLREIPMDTKLAKTKKFILAGPWFPVILMLVIPLLSVYLTVMCTRQSCVPRLVNFPSNWDRYVDIKTFIICIGWIAFQSLLCLIPFGSVCKGLTSKHGTRLSYRCNGFIGLIITLIVVVGLVAAKIRWNRVPSVTYVLDHFLALEISAIILALLIGTLVYVTSRLYARERDLNQFGNSGNCLYDAAVGHEMHPRLFRGLDLKVFTWTRLSMISTATLALLFLIKDFERRGGIGKAPINVPLVLVVIQQLVYVADSLLLEDALMTSFAMQREGFGLIHSFSRLVWMPFITTMPARYMCLRETSKWPSYCYAGVVMLYIAAFVIRRASISMKFNYRRDPNNPNFSSVAIIQSSYKGLLAGGWWGLVRHPNYLGELFMYIAWTLPIGLKMTTPWICLLLLLLTFVVRMRMVENYCAQRHGSAWKSYCEKVRSRLVPFLL